MVDIRKIESKDLLLDLGLQPVSNRFLKNKSDTCPKFPFKVVISRETGLISLNKTFPIKEIRPRYDWITHSEPEEHLDTLVDMIVRLPGISERSVVGSYSFKDNSTLERLRKIGFKNLWNINPRQDLGIKNEKCSVETFQSRFNMEKANKLANKYGLADIVIVRHVLEHAYNIGNFINSIKKLIKKEGYIVWEIPDCEKSLKKLDYTMFWEEHVYYFTEFTLKQLLKSYNFKIINFSSFNNFRENSLVAIVKFEKDFFYKKDKYFNKKLKKEILQAKFFARSLTAQRKKIKKKIFQFRGKFPNSNVAIYGAGHLTVAFISIMQLANLISFVIDDNSYKQNMIMPIGNIPIVNSKELCKGNIKLCLSSLNLETQSKIISKNKDFINKGGVFLSIFPTSNFYIKTLI